MEATGWVATRRSVEASMEDIVLSAFDSFVCKCFGRANALGMLLASVPAIFHRHETVMVLFLLCFFST